MWKVTVRNLLARKLRLALSGFAIVLGVAFVAGSFIFTDSLGRAFDGIVGGTTADVEILPEGAGDVGTLGIDARTIPASVVDDLAELPGAAQVAGTDQVNGVFVIGRDGKVVGGNGPPGLAYNYTGMTSMAGEPILTLAQGRMPSGPGEIALDVDTAAKAGYEIGDQVSLVTPGEQPTLRAELVGEVDFGSDGGLVGATLTIFDEDWLQELFFGGQDVYTNISMSTAAGVSQVELRDAAAAVVPPGLEVKTGEDAAAEAQQDIATILGFINTFLLVFAAVAMVVGTFLIVNTFSILVAQRSRELALLRAMGASRWQVNRSVLSEALVVGLLGSTLGIGMGYLLAIGLKALFATLGLDLGKAGMSLEPRTIAFSYLVGVVVTVVAAYLPARRAGRVPPIQAMQEHAAVPESSLRRRLLVGASMSVVGAGAIVMGFRLEGNTRLILLGLGMLAILVGASLASAVVGRPVVVALGALFRRTSGTVGTLATQNSLRNPRRTAATASALMVGLTLVTLMSILGQSAKASTDKAIESSLSAELIVSNATSQFFSPRYGEEIAQLDGVAQVVPIRIATAKLGDDNVFIQATDPSALGTALDVPVPPAALAQFGTDTVLMNQSKAASLGLAAGDRVTLTFMAGPRDFTLLGVYPAAGNAINADVLMSLDGLAQAGVQPQDSLLFITKSPGASEAEVRAEIDQVLADNPTVTLKNQQEFIDEQKGLIDTFLYIIYALLGLAVIIAVLGITNTLALSVIERTREIGLLRAVGMARRQLRSMIRMESTAIAVLGAVLGVVLGTGFGTVLQRAIADEGIDVLAIPWLRLGIFVVLAAVVGVLAAVFPARRAARLNVLAAITTE